MAATLDVLKVAMRPGKPVKIGMIGAMLFAGLPGNPNAALVTFRQIALPAIRTIAGLRQIGTGLVAGGRRIRLRKAARPNRVRAGQDRSAATNLGRPVLDMLGRGSSASLMAMALADGIALLPPGCEPDRDGMPLRFEPFCSC